MRSCVGLRLTYSRPSRGGWSGRGGVGGRPGLRAAVSRLCSRVPPRGGAGPSQKVLLGVLQPLQVRGRDAGRRVGGAVPCCHCFPRGVWRRVGAGARRESPAPGTSASPARPGRGTHTGPWHGARRAGDPPWRSAPPRTASATAGHSVYVRRGTPSSLITQNVSACPARRFELVFSARAQHPWEAQNPGRITLPAVLPRLTQFLSPCL